MTPIPAFSHSDARLQKILREAKSIAVVGASAKPWRDSRSIMQFLIHAGYSVIPVNPNYSEVLGERCYPDLRSVPQSIDIVNVFRRPDEVLSITDDAVAVKATTLWFQTGVVNKHAAERALQAGIQVVMDLCIAVEYRRLMGIPAR